MNKKILILLFVGVLMGALDIAIVGPAIPVLQKVFHIDIRSASWIFNIYLLTNIIATPLMAKLSDRNGRRGIYILSIVLFAIGSIVVAFSTSFEMMLIGRAIQGFGSGGIFPTAAAVIGDTVEKAKQGRALGMIGMVFGIAFILGPIVGGVLLLWSWKLIFLINLPIAAGLIFYASKLLPSNKKEVKEPFDWKGMSLLILSLGMFSWAINQIDSEQFIASVTSPLTFTFFIISILLLFVFYFFENKHISPVFDVKLLHSKQLRISYFIAFSAGLAETVPMFIPNYCHKAFGMSDSASSFALIPMVVALTIGAPSAGRILDKIGAKKVLVGGVILVLLGLIVFTIWGGSLVGFYSSEIILGFGLSALLGAPLRYIMNNETTEEERASGQGLLSLCTNTGQMLTAALLGALIASLNQTAEAYHQSFMWLGATLILTLIFSLRLKKV